MSRILSLLMVLLAVPLASYAGPIPVDRVLAEVDGAPITEGMVHDHLAKALGSEWRQRIDTEAKMEKARNDVVEQLVRVMVIEREMKRLQIKVDPRQVRRKVSEMRATLRRENKRLEQVLAEGHSHMWYLERALRGAVGLFGVVEEHITDDNVRRYYNVHRKKFPRQRRVRHLLVMTLDKKTRAPLPYEQQQAAKQKILAARKALQEGADFADLIAKFSDGPRAAKGGELPLLTEGDAKMDARFMEVSFALSKIGQVSRVVRTRYGYHMIQLLAAIEPTWKDARQQCIEDTQERYMRRLLDQAVIKRFDAKTGEPVKKSKPKSKKSLIPWRRGR